MLDTSPCTDQQFRMAVLQINTLMRSQRRHERHGGHRNIVKVNRVPQHKTFHANVLMTNSSIGHVYFTFTCTNGQSISPRIFDEKVVIFRIHMTMSPEFSRCRRDDPFA